MKLRSHLLSSIVCLQIGLAAVTGVGVVASLPVWSVADERAHAAYVDAVGEGTLPVLGQDRLPPEIDSLGGKAKGLAAASSYEAFQPPLYYVAAALPWDAAQAVGGTGFAVRALRALDLLALGAALLLLWRLARRVAESREVALAGFAVAMAFVIWPGVIMRAITISNGALEMPLVAGALLALWTAWDQRSSRALIVAGGVCGLGILCRAGFLGVAVLLPVVAWRFRATARRAALGAVALPLMLVAPWILLNLHRYGAPTANAIVRQMQGGFLNPSGRHYDLVRLFTEADQRLLNGPWPEEWPYTLAFDPAVRAVVRAASAVLVGLPLLVWLARGPRRAWMLIVPLLAGVVVLQIISLAADFAFIQPRYLYSVLPAFGLGVGLALTRAGGRRLAGGFAACVTVGMAALWIYLTTLSGLQTG